METLNDDAVYQGKRAKHGTQAALSITRRLPVKDVRKNLVGLCRLNPEPAFQEELLTRVPGRGRKTLGGPALAIVSRDGSIWSRLFQSKHSSLDTRLQTPQSAT